MFAVFGGFYLWRTGKMLKEVDAPGGSAPHRNRRPPARRNGLTSPRCRTVGRRRPAPAVNSDRAYGTERDEDRAISAVVVVLLGWLVVCYPAFIFGMAPMFSFSGCFLETQSRTRLPASRSCPGSAALDQIGAPWRSCRFYAGMMQHGLVLTMIGILMGLPFAMYSYSRPRRAGEPLGQTRTFFMSISAPVLCLSWSGRRCSSVAARNCPWVRSGS
jgi:hypothetical protein